MLHFALTNGSHRPRYYGLDALRACMILLGIFFHVLLPYTGLPMHGYYVTDQRSFFCS